MFLNQIQAGVGTKDDGDTALTASQFPIGPGVNMKPIFDENDQNLIVTIYVGEKTYFDDSETIRRKIKGMLERLKIDFVICGPSFNYPDFSRMSVDLAKDVNSTTAVKAICAMSEENAELIAENKEELDIVKMPKKSGAGLNDSYIHLSKVLQEKADGKERSAYQEYIY